MLDDRELVERRIIQELGERVGPLVEVDRRPLNRGRTGLPSSGHSSAADQLPSRSPTKSCDDRVGGTVTKADYAIVGDLHEVVPAIVTEIRRRRE